MPLARIITRYPEHISDLSQQLQLEGYSVEIAAPEEAHLQPADLEIDFAICNPSEVLQRAAHRATELGADVVVASGVLDLAAQPSAVDTVERQSGEVMEIHTQPQPEQAVTQVSGADAGPVQPVVLQPSPLESSPIQLASGQPIAEESGHELPAYNPHFAANLGTQLRESLNGLGVSAVELTRRIVEHLRTAAASARSRMEAAKANRAQIALQQAEAEAQGANLPIAQQQQLEQKTQSELPKATTRQPVPALAKRSKIPSVRRTPVQLRGIFTGAAAASVLFVVGLILASVHPRSPLPVSMTQTSVEQHVPFGAIIVQGTPVQRTLVRPAANVAQPKIIPPRANLQPRENNQPPAHKKPHPYRARAAANEGEDDVTADDVVVRHFPAQVKRPAAQQQARLKKYSDMN